MLTRWMFGLPGAAVISALIFLGMAWMIRQEAPPPVDPNTPKISILPVIKPASQRIAPSRPDSKIVPPPVTEIDFPPVEGDPGAGIKYELPRGPTGGPGPIILPATMQPVVKIPPAYPENCKARGAAGVVIVEFDVTAEGDVINPRIISSADGCLDRTVLSTIQKWKYPPPEQDGRPAARRGVREVFNFQLTE